MKKYISEKRKEAAMRMINWDKYIKVATYMEQGIETSDIAKLMNLCGQRIYDIKNQIDGMTVLELLELKNKYQPE